MAYAMFDAALTDPTMEGKVRQLVSVLLEIPPEDVTDDLNWKSQLDEERVPFYCTMVAEALTTYFNCACEMEDIEQLNTVQDIIDLINNKT